MVMVVHWVFDTYDGAKSHCVLGEYLILMVELSHAVSLVL